MKRCSRCDKEKPLTTEFYHRCSKHSTGLKSDCKECRNEINRKRRGSKKREWAEKDGSSIITDFKEYYRKYQENNKERYKEYSRRYYQKNRERYKNYGKEYYQKNKDRYKEYYERNKERYKEYYIENKEKISAYQSTPEYKMRRRPKARFNKNKRDAMKRSLLNTFTKNDWNYCLAHFDYSCAYCGERKKSFHQDHFIPISKGGEYTKYNIVPTCETCNIRKSDRDFKEWYTEQDFYDPKREERVLKYLKYKNELQQISLF